MSYFPAFIKLDNKKILLVGGGNIAYEKLTKLLDFTQNIEIISLDFSVEILQLIKKHQLSFSKRQYEVGDIKDVAIVVVAVDDIEVQKEIYEESQNFKCLCNAVDSVEYCDFIFPSYIKKDDLTIAISTSGASPSFAKYFRTYLEGVIPNGMSEFLKELKALRTALPKGKERMKLLDEKVKKFFIDTKE
jgi:precorrin-2 dehydrogenase/sirohydrochlorin ferrochelatase